MQAIPLEAGGDSSKCFCYQTFDSLRLELSDHNCRGGQEATLGGIRAASYHGARVPLPFQSGYHVPLSDVPLLLGDRLLLPRLRNPTGPPPTLARPSLDSVGTQPSDGD